MEQLKNMTQATGLYTEEVNGQLKGNSINVRSYPVFRLWINKSGNLTVKTRGVQKSFKEWRNKDTFKNILRGFEII